MSKENTDVKSLVVSDSSTFGGVYRRARLSNSKDGYESIPSGCLRAFYPFITATSPVPIFISVRLLLEG